MAKQEPLYLEKVRNSEVGLGLHGFFCDLLLLFLICAGESEAFGDTNACISRLNHLSVVVAVADRQDFHFEEAFCDLDDIRLLTWRHFAKDSQVSLHQNFEQDCVELCVYFDHAEPAAIYRQQVKLAASSRVAKETPGSDKGVAYFRYVADEATCDVDLSI